VKIFIDANVLVATLNKEYPVFSHSARVLSLADSPKFNLYTSSLCLAISFYFASKKSGNQVARKKIKLLKEKMDLAVISEKAVQQALYNPKVLDLEDGFQYYAAQEAKCSCIVTEDRNDFHFAEMEILDCESFLQKHFFESNS